METPETETETSDVLASEVLAELRVLRAKAQKLQRLGAVGSRKLYNTICEAITAAVDVDDGVDID